MENKIHEWVESIDQEELYKFIENSSFSPSEIIYALKKIEKWNWYFKSYNYLSSAILRDNMDNFITYDKEENSNYFILIGEDVFGEWREIPTKKELLIAFKSEREITINKIKDLFKTSRLLLEYSIFKKIKIDY